MFKKILSLVFCMMLFCSISFAATDEEAVESFKQYVNDEMTKVFATYEGVHYSVLYMEKSQNLPDSYSYWYKSTSIIDKNYKIDLRKTDSLLSPYVGILEVAKNSFTYQNSQTKEAAEAAKDIVSIYKVIYRLNIVYDNDKWVVSNYENSLNNGATWMNYPIKDDVSNILMCYEDKH